MPTHHQPPQRSREETLRAMGLKAGAKVVGIASAAAVDRRAPLGHRPSDLLEGAKSVIVFGDLPGMAGAYHTPVSRIRGLNRAFDIPVRNGIARQVARFIEREYGHYAVFATDALSGFNPPLSIKLCAEMAGLGTRSMAASILLHPEYGMLNFSAVVTTLPLAADGPLAEPVCPHPSCVKLWEAKGTLPCLEACPDCLSGSLENGRIKQLQYNRYLCSTRAQVTGPRTFQKLLLEVLEEPDPRRRKMMLLSNYFTRVVTSMATGSALVGQCSVCILPCPVGRRYRHPRPVATEGTEGPVAAEGTEGAVAADTGAAETAERSERS